MTTRTHISAKSIRVSNSFIIILLLLACKNEGDKLFKTKWTAALSAPANYPIDGAKVIFLNKGEVVNVASTLTSIWGSWSLPQKPGDRNNETILPDSVFIKYGALNDKNQMCSFEGKIGLPQSKIIQLFNERKSDKIIVGMAPGGRVCVWADNIEIIRGTLEQKEIYRKEPIIFFGDKQQTLAYLKHHPVNYHDWEKTDSRYELDFGFCSQDDSAQYFNGYFYSKEGVFISGSKSNVDITKWGVPYGQPATLVEQKNYKPFSDRIATDNYRNLPVHAVYEWKTGDETIYSTEVIMPADLPTRFTKAYRNSETGRSTHYNRLVLGVEKDGVHAIIWLDGPGKQEKLMRFKAQRERPDGDETVNSGGYATEVTYH